MLGLPLVGTLGVPTLFLGAVILFLCFFRRYFDEENPQELFAQNQKQSPKEEAKAVEEVLLNSGAEESCQDCHCGKNSEPDENAIKRLCIVYGTTTGNAKSFAEDLAKKAANAGLEVEVNNVQDVEPEDKLPVEAQNPNSALVVIISTYTEGSPPETAEWFCKWLEEAAKDFRIQHSLLQGLKFGVFGLGHSLYSDYFNTVGRNCDKFLHQLSGERIVPLGLGDENVDKSKHGSLEADFEAWSGRLLANIANRNQSGERNAGSSKVEANENQEEEEDFSDESSVVSSVSDDEEEENEGLVDLEDLGNVMKKSKDAAKMSAAKPKEMITPTLRKSLTKQGYKLIGSHSGVKICRWTKAMMRGRGGCYKHTFYGIESHRCMETTPSLACANKCVFCWRHHSNPVGTEWKWAMDEPELILDGALENHYKMIKQMKGVPGVLPERYQEGFDVRHCALSLVGEPIMYPEINK